MRSGLKRDYLTFERNTPTQGVQGQEIDNWNVLFYAWGYIRGSVSNEQEAVHQIRIRYEADLTHRDRIVFGSRIFNIKSRLDKDGRGRELVLQVSEVV